MKEGCQSSWILQDETIELFGEIMCCSSRREKSDPKGDSEIIRAASLVSVKKTIALLLPGQTASAQSRRGRAAQSCGDGASWQSPGGRLLPSRALEAAPPPHWRWDHCPSGSERWDFCPSGPGGESMEPKRVILEL